MKRGASPLAYAGVAGGLASLDSGGHIPIAQLPAAIQGAFSIQGSWNATTNSPALASGTGTQGYAYRVSTAGTTSLDGIASWNVGDWVIFNGTAWVKLDGITNEVIVAAGKTLTANNTLTLAGTDGTTLTGPAASAKLLSTDGAIYNNPSLGNGAGLTAASKMFGLAAAFTPKDSTRAVFKITVGVTNSGGVLSEITLNYGTGTAPANGAAAAGTAITAAVPVQTAVGGYIPVTLEGGVTGLTPGTAYWFDVQLSYIASGTTALVNNDASAWEV